MKSKWEYKQRYTAISMVFFVWVLSYMDRMVMATAIPFIAKDFNLSTGQMGIVMSSFFAGYALCQIPGGILSDKFGPRKVMVSAIGIWSLFTAITGAVTSLGQMLIVRMLFGVGEGIAPAATWKALANWTPQKNRAMANALMMSSNSLGPALAPLFVVGIIAAWGWRSVFYALFIPGILMCIWIWYKLPDNPADKKGITEAELEELKDDVFAHKNNAETELGEVKKLTFFEVFSIPAVYKSFLILFFSNITFWGFSSWLPTYLSQARGLNTTSMGVAASLPFFAGTVSTILVGWLMDNTFKHNRKLPIIVFQLIGAFFLYLTFTTESISLVIVYQTITGFFLIGAAISIFALPMSAISKEITGQAMGIVNTAGQLAAFLSPVIVGFLIVELEDGTKNFDTAFMFLISSFLISATIAALFFKQTKTVEASSAT